MGDKCFKAYFEFHKEPEKRTLIFELHYDRKNLKYASRYSNAIFDYYNNLYSKNKMVETNIQAKLNCFSSLSKIMT